MKKTINKVCVVFFLIESSLLCAGGKNPSTTLYGVSCIADKMYICDNQINAVGDLIEWNIAKILREDFGPISGRATFYISFPKNGKKMLYTFIPTNGLFKNEQVEILLLAFSLEEKVPNEVTQIVKNEVEVVRMKYTWAKNMVKVYRRLPGQPLWEELITILSDDQNASDSRPTRVEIEKDGKAYITQQEYRKIDGTISQERIVIFGLAQFSL